MIATAAQGEVLENAVLALVGERGDDLLAALRHPLFSEMATFTREELEWASRNDSSLLPAAGGTTPFKGEEYRRFHGFLSRLYMMCVRERPAKDSEKYREWTDRTVPFVQTTMARLFESEATRLTWPQLTDAEVKALAPLRGASPAGGRLQDDGAWAGVTIDANLLDPRLTFIVWWARTGGAVPDWFGKPHASA